MSIILDIFILWIAFFIMFCPLAVGYQIIRFTRLKRIRAYLDGNRDKRKG